MRLYFLFFTLVSAACNIIISNSSTSIPKNVMIEYMNFGSHLGWPKEYCFSNPIGIWIPIPYSEFVKVCYVITEDVHNDSALNSFKFTSPPSSSSDGNFLILWFGWYGPGWRLGTGFSLSFK